MCGSAHVAHFGEAHAVVDEAGAVRDEAVALVEPARAGCSATQSCAGVAGASTVSSSAWPMPVPWCAPRTYSE